MKKIIKNIGIVVLFIILFASHSWARVVVEEKLEKTFGNEPKVVIQCGNGKKVTIYYDPKNNKPCSYGLITLSGYVTLKEAADDACHLDGK